MAHVGSLGTPREADAITFDYFGEVLTVAENLTDLEYVDFMDAQADTPANSPAGRRFIKDFARLVWGDDFDRFWALAKKNGQNSTDVFTSLSEALEAATARPTESPSDSSDGQRSTEPRSAGGSSSVAERLAGRPDLQLVVAQAQEALAS